MPPVALVVLTLAVWARSFAVPILGWDDDVYLYQDERIQSVSIEKLQRIWTTAFFANYHPVTTLSYALDRAVWGENEAGFHVQQLAFYTTGVVLLYFLFLTLLGSRSAAFWGAAIYAVHAIHVEPVAWLAQRKDVVCLVFYSGALLAYIRQARREALEWRLYLGAVALAALAMLSKGYAVILPVVFIAHDLCFARDAGRRRILDKLPFLALALAVTTWTILAQESVAALQGAGDLSITAWERFVLNAKIFAVYVGRALLPVQLSAKYSVGHDWLPGSVAWVGVALAMAAGTAFWRLRRTLPAVAFGIALFVVPLATVMNLSSFFDLRTWIADRYLFFPTIGSSLALVSAGLWLQRRGRLEGHFLIACAAACTFLYGGLSIARIGVWESPVQLWSDTVRRQMRLAGSGPLTAEELQQVAAGPGGLVIPDPSAYAALIGAYRRTGEIQQARALADGLSRKSMGSSGVALEIARRDIEAGRHDRALATLKPLLEAENWIRAEALLLTGEALSGKGERDAARVALQQSLDAYRSHGLHGADALLALGTLEFGADHFGKAADWYGRAHEAHPASPRAAFNLGLALDALGQHSEAYDLYGSTLALLEGSRTRSVDPADVHQQMGKTVGEKLDRPAEAASHYQEVLRLRPDHPEREALEYWIDRARVGQDPAQDR